MNLRGPACLLLLACGTAAAGEPRVVLDRPHAHGWWIGDLLPVTATVRVDAAMALDPASLPKPGAVTYWLDLHSVTVARDEVAAGERTIVLDLVYQTFYAPLEPKRMQAPAVPLEFVGPAGRTAVDLPSWSFVTSPIREIMEPTTVESMQPDSRLAVIDTHPAQVRAVAGLLIGLLASVALAWHHALGPFARRSRPFGAAASQVRRLLRGGDAVDGYRASLLALHRAFDAAFGRRLLAGDVEAFVARWPRYQQVADELDAFFVASRALFFGSGAEDASRQLPPQRLRQLADRLAAVERGP